MNRGSWPCRSSLGVMAVGVGFAIAATSCGTSAQLPPRVTFVERATPKAPVLCHTTGPQSLVRSDVFGPGGLTAREHEGTFEVSFPLQEEQRIVVNLKTPTDWHPAAPEPPTDDGDVKLLNAMVARDEQLAHAPTFAKSGDYNLVAWESESDDGPLVFLAFVAYDLPHRMAGMTTGGQPRVVTTTFTAPPGGLQGVAIAPSLAALGDGFFLLVWSQGDDNTQQLRGEPIDGAGVPVGPSVELSAADATIVGQSAVAIGPNGDGYVAYVVSRLASFDVVAAPLVCTR